MQNHFAVALNRTAAVAAPVGVGPAAFVAYPPALQMAAGMSGGAGWLMQQQAGYADLYRKAYEQALAQTRAREATRELARAASARSGREIVFAVAQRRSGR